MASKEELRNAFAEAIKDGLSPSDVAIRLDGKYKDLLVDYWINLYSEFYGFEKNYIANLFVAWHPSVKSQGDLTNEEFDRKILRMKNA